MKKYVKLMLIVFVISLLFIQPVSAGFWDKLFGKSVAKTIVKNEEKVVAKEYKSISNTIKEEKIINTEKQLSKEEQLAKNIEAGAKWEKTVIETYCSKQKCFYNQAKIGNQLYYDKIYSTIYPNSVFGGEYFIIGGKTTNVFIKDYSYLFHGDIAKYFTKEPDMLRVTARNGNIEKLEIIDAKLSPEATRSEQDAAFKLLCQNAKIPCTVSYDVPQKTANLMDIVCTASIAIPDINPIDAICVILAFVK